uniref:FAD-dependent oxidoreductase domain-containing protein 1 n=1 Tax=Alexandrium monilatum TaxID=311494 RepID=A0A7S4Q6P0_9DINO
MAAAGGVRVVGRSAYVAALRASLQVLDACTMTALCGGLGAVGLGQRRSLSIGAGARPVKVVVAGSGVSGSSVAMHLARRGVHVTLVDPRPPLTASSQYSTESYRTFFMDAVLVPFMTRSVDIMEDLAGDENVISLNRRGYCFLASSQSGAEALERFADTASSFGAGPVRRHRDTIEAYVRSPSHGFRHPEMHGFDLVYGSSNIRGIFPFVSSEAQVMLHARRCGWMDAQGLGQAMLRVAKEGAGSEVGSARLLRGSIQGFDVTGGSVVRVHTSAEGDEVPLECDAFVNAAGAWMPAVNSLLAPVEPLPLKNEVHAKVILHDSLGVIPQDTAPFMVWRDSVTLDWDEETREGLRELDDTAEGGIVNSANWVQPQPGGQHLRPAGNGRVLLLWEHLHRHLDVPQDPAMPIEQFLDMYPQLCLEGLRAMVPGLEAYRERLGRATTVDGGYYTVTPDGRPLVGRHGARNAFVCGGMGTYGLMGSPAAGELAALHVLGGELPSYAGACTWPREDPLTEKPIDLLDDSG